MVAAAFIGPGTITAASIAGVETGVSLVWAIVFSVIATLILQELAVRSALATDRDLSTLTRDFGAGRWWGAPLLMLIVIAIGVGNAAYQSGNLSGAGIGLNAAMGVNPKGVVLLSAAAASGLILANRYRWLERILVGLVGVMAVLFIGLAVLAAPRLSAQPAERLLPAFSSESLHLVLALIGTTVVPYNLFLHATAARRRWQGESVAEALQGTRRESFLAIVIGGMITVAVVVVAAALVSADTSEPALPAVMMAIEGYLPGGGAIAVGIGLFAAGLTSAIAAPVAASWAVCGALGWSTEPGSRSFKAVALLVVIAGTFFAIVTDQPAALIVTAQVTNALLLPLIALLLVAIANSRLLPDGYRNRGRQNAAAAWVLITVCVLAISKLIGALG
jgi:manganese transport protein